MDGVRFKDRTAVCTAFGDKEKARKRRRPEYTRTLRPAVSCIVGLQIRLLFHVTSNTPRTINIHVLGH
jgi:hypothetical protein